MTARFIVADVFDGLAQLEDGSVDLVVTSPPFLALRSYLPADHHGKEKEIGSEATPAEWLDTMLRVTGELRRVLAPHGSICIELGDTYAGSGGAGGDYGEDGLREGQPKFKANPGRNSGTRYQKPGMPSIPAREYQDQLAKGGDGWPLAKSKTLIPELYEIALAYGFNPLTGHQSPAGRWRIRNIVDWCRPNPPVGALGDKWRPATSDVVVACVSDKRYWDDIATRREHQIEPTGEPDFTQRKQSDPSRGNGGDMRGYMLHHGNSHGAPLLDYWEIPPGGYQGAHYAVFPSALVEPLIKAMAPPKVCRQCGEPARRIREHLGRDRFPPDLSVAEFAERLRGAMDRSGLDRESVAVALDVTPRMVSFYLDEPSGTGRLPSISQWGLLRELLQWRPDDLSRLALVPQEYETEDRGNRNIPERLSGGPLNGDKPKVVATGWSDCGHDDYRPALILDPFAGSGTTLSVATGHGHDAIGIDLDERNRDLAYERIGPFMWEEETA